MFMHPQKKHSKVSIHVHGWVNDFDSSVVVVAVAELHLSALQFSWLHQSLISDGRDCTLPIDSLLLSSHVPPGPASYQCQNQL
jgi:hypothetical protein